MVVGEQRRLAINKASAATMTNPKIAKITFTNGGVLISAKQAGLGSLVLGKKLNPMQIIIYSQKLKAARKQIVNWLTDKFGLFLSTNPQNLIISGKALRLADWLQLQKFKAKFPKQLLIEAKIDRVLVPTLKKALERSLSQRSISSMHSRIENDQVILLSSSKNKDDKVIAQAVAREWGLENPQSSDLLELKPMIEIEVVIAEVKKSSFQTLGLQLPGTYSATITPAGDLSSLATSFNSFSPEFHALFNKGNGRVLANPKILCRSGEMAHFVAGGEIPIKIINWKNSDVVWKRYGVILDINPKADLDDGISTKLTTEVSLLDEVHKIDGIPGLFTNRIETYFDLRGSKTIALSGLIKSELGRSQTGTPLLGEIPILGALFRSQDYKDNRTELIVFVTPRVISPEAPPPIPASPALSNEWDNE